MFLTFLQMTTYLMMLEWFIMCLDQKNAGFVQQCIRRGIHYIDISASYSILCQIEALSQEAQTSGTTAVLSVGLAPGLTNLLVKHSQSKLPDITRADIYVLLGSGESYGDAALQWTLEGLNSNFAVLNNGISKQVRSFEEGKQTVFPNGIGKRTTYRFDFSDQHVLPRTLGLKSVSTWLCFDDATSTQLLAWIRKSGLSHVLKIKSVEKALIGLMKRFQYGSEEFAVRVEAGNQETDVLYECSLRGDVQGRITGWVAAKVAEKLASSSLPSGVFHIEQVFHPGEFFADLAELGVKFEEREYAVSGSKA